MKKLILILVVLYSAPAFADCLTLPIIGDGSEGSPYRPDIPKSLAQYAWTAHIPPKIPFKADGPKYADAIVCLPDSVKLPISMAPMTRDIAIREMAKRDPRIDVSPLSVKVPEPKTVIGKMIEAAIRGLWRWLEPALAWATSSTDNFNRADNADLGAAWDVYTTPCQILSNAAHSDGGGTNRCIEGYNTYIPTANQYVEITLAGNTPTSGDVSALVRLQAPTTYSTYLCRANFGEGGASSNIQRRDAGSLANLASESSTNWGSAPDVIRCEITNSAITFKRNGSTLLTTANDGTYTSGRGGIGIFDDLDFIDNFEVGDLPTSSRAPRKPIIYQ